MSSQSQIMSGYYSWQSSIYGATRWSFLFDRGAIIDDMQLASGATVIEVGCGTGHNLEGILKRIGPTGEIIAVDCSTPMIERCSTRIRAKGWKNVRLLDQEYGRTPVTDGGVDAVLLSYSLSMIPDWEQTLECALGELKPGGRIGVVDFCLEERNLATLRFAYWMARNRVRLDRPYREKLGLLFRRLRCVTRRAPGSLWSFYRFVGERRLQDNLIKIS